MYDGHQRGLVSMIYEFVTKKLLVEYFKMEMHLIRNIQKNYTNQSLENLGEEKFTHLLQTIFGPISRRYSIDK